MQKLVRALSVCVLILSVCAVQSSADAWNMSESGLALYGKLVQTRDFLTVDDAGNPVKCRFLGHDSDELSGIVILAYVTWENRAEVTRREILFWRVIQGDIVDIESNYFVMTSGGQLARITLETQRVWPASW